MTVTFRTIGCRTNQEEMAALRAKLLALGYSTTDKIENADIIIVNTCSVTSATESKTGRYIRSLSRTAQNARILVTGCFAQQHGEALLKYPGVVWVVGNGDKHRIPSIIADSGSCTGAAGAYLSDINSDSSAFWDTPVICPIDSERTRFSMKIQEGCDYRCAYCIVPSLRGRSRCAPSKQLIDTFKQAVDKGYKEIVLTGTHIGQYKDSNQCGGLTQYNIESLLEDLLKVSGDYRIRLSSLDPRDLTDTIIAAAGTDARVCPHLHVSVQSLSAGVLARMGRPYAELDALIDRLRDFREKYPHAGLGGDFIVGHPGETDAMFEETLCNAERIGFTYGHVFRFSKRAATEAALMPDQTGERVKSLRSDILRVLLEKNREKILLMQAPHPLRIIVETKNPVRGVSGNYIKIEAPDARAAKNSWMQVTLTGEVSGGYCVGREYRDSLQPPRSV